MLSFICFVNRKRINACKNDHEIRVLFASCTENNVKCKFCYKNHPVFLMLVCFVNRKHINCCKKDHIINLEFCLLRTQKIMWFLLRTIPFSQSFVWFVEKKHINCWNWKKGHVIFLEFCLLSQQKYINYSKKNHIIALFCFLLCHMYISLSCVCFFNRKHINCCKKDYVIFLEFRLLCQQ